MAKWLSNWRRAWRTEPVTLGSPLPLPVARERLRAGRTTFWQALRSGAGGYRVIGRVGERSVSLAAVRAGAQNSWRPELRGRLEPAETGSRLVGSIGWSPFVRIFSTVWLCGAGAAFVGLLAVGLDRALHGEVSPALAACLVPLGFMASFVGITVLGVRWGRADEAYLRSWLADRLRTAGHVVPPRPAGGVPAGPVRIRPSHPDGRQPSPGS
ncbi:hypothetical protein [Actinoplanes philippinensis]|uniref:hypothetical protein n=1 Tax=Actinoplanes philippinensis TaxID=35752 RepID=UPI0033F84F36